MSLGEKGSREPGLRPGRHRRGTELPALVWAVPQDAGFTWKLLSGLVQDR